MHQEMFISGLIAVFLSILASFRLWKAKLRNDTFSPPWTYKRLVYLCTTVAFFGGLLAFGPIFWPQRNASHMQRMGRRSIDSQLCGLGCMFVVVGLIQIYSSVNLKGSGDVQRRKKRIIYIGGASIALGAVMIIVSIISP